MAAPRSSSRRFRRDGPESCAGVFVVGGCRGDCGGAVGPVDDDEPLTGEGVGVDFPAISNEALTDSPDFVGQFQRRLTYGVIQRERADLAAICGDEVAWRAYPPTPLDDPAEYAPYWSRLTDVVKDADEREAIVAAWLTARRPHA